MRKGIHIFLIASLVITLDFLTKKAIVAKVMPYDKIDILPFLRIVYVENKGAAFGLFSNLGNSFFIAVSIIAISFIIIYAMKTSNKMEASCLSLIIGGAIGNLIDRLTIGKVIDFIDVFIGNWHWPAFNVADSALTVGITLFIISNIRSEKFKK